MWNVIGIVLLMLGSLILTIATVSEIVSSDDRNPTTGLALVILILILEGYFVFFVLYPWAASQSVG